LKIQNEEDLKRKIKEVQDMEELLKLKHGLPHLFGFPFYLWARRIFESKSKEIFLTSANQVSKDLESNTLIPTPSGFVKIKDLQIGDYVFDQNGIKTKVIGIPYEGRGPGYRLTFSDGSEVVCGPNHDWICKGSRQRFRKNYKKYNGENFDNNQYGLWIVKSLKEIMAYYSPLSSNYQRHSIPVCDLVKFDKKNIFDPYAIGYLIGNGSLSSPTIKVTINSLDSDISEYFITEHGAKQQGKPIDYRLPVELRNKIVNLGLNVKSIYKSIPPAYLSADVDQRLALLRGLMDSDGTVGKRGFDVSFSTSSKNLAYDFASLVHSLGGIAQIKRRSAGYKKNGLHVRCNDSFHVSIWTKFNPFRSARKSAKWVFSNKYKFERILNKIEYVGEINSRCITVEAIDGSFLCTRDYIVTHNSSTAIRKNINLATNPLLWKEFWPQLQAWQKPGLFWYFYPTKETVTTEVEEKWEKEFLPQGEFKTHPQYGWKIEYDKGNVHAIKFNTGVTIQFKTYAQKVKDLQTSSVYHLTCDEELPVELLPELKARLNATDGYFLMVFTATLGQLYWKQTMEPATPDEEKHKDALKIQVSLFDSMRYEDGSPSPWTKEKIQRAINNCPTEAEIQRRIYGRFVKSEGLMYEGFSLERNMSEKHPLPKDWQIFTGIDPGSGGKSGHPAAMVFIAVNPNYREGRVFRGWRGDGIPTSSQDILDKYKELKESLSPVVQTYDYAAKDFFLIASRSGEAFTPADKGRERGVALLNTLFKSGILKIQRGDPELDKLVNEICSLSHSTKKTVAIDDFVDSLRYACMSVPWDFSAIEMSEKEKENLGMKSEKARPLTEEERRRDWILSTGKKSEQTIDEEIDFWGDLY
jgi:hypothetical protein